MRTTYALLIIGLMVLTACGNGSKPTTSGTTQQYKPTLGVSMDVLGNQIKVFVDTDMRIAADRYGGARKSGEGHIHMYLDDGEKIGVKEAETVIRDVTPGKHTLKVSLHNNDHTPYDVTQKVTFEIK
jgi:hypothetical protein